jgi:glycerate-2-kinase
MTVPVPVNLAAAQEAIIAWFRVALDAVEPERATRAAIRIEDSTLWIGQTKHDLPRRIYIVGAGKAAVPMARGVEAALGDRITGGLVVTKDGHVIGQRPARIAVVEAAHPVPDQRGLDAGQRILDLVASLTSEDRVIAVISGGGSALLEALRPPMTLDDLQTLTSLMLHAGAPITDLNAVRSALSLMKAGGLRVACPAPMDTLILSDVLGNDPRVIASGPTIPSEPLPVRALRAMEILRRYDLLDRVPSAVRGTLETATSTLSETAELMERAADDAIVIVGDNAKAAAAFARAARADGLGVERPAKWQQREGEAARLGREFVLDLLALPAAVDVVVGGGEATVTVRGDGRGGRNTEFAVAAALALTDAGNDDWIVASLATDGQDALTGVAGAIADGQTVQRAAAAGVDAHAALQRNDSYAVFEAAGGLVNVGPTGTNVNDLYVALRRQSDGRRGDQ